jgi:hypothetical protein
LRQEEDLGRQKAEGRRQKAEGRRQKEEERRTECAANIILNLREIMGVTIFPTPDI